MGIFDFFKKRKENLDNNFLESNMLEEKIHIAEKEIDFTAVKETSKESQNETEKKLLSMVNLDGYKSLSGGYMNYTEFLVSGQIINPKTAEKIFTKKSSMQEQKLMLKKKQKIFRLLMISK